MLFGMIVASVNPSAAAPTVPTAAASTMPLMKPSTRDTIVPDASRALARPIPGSAIGARRLGCGLVALLRPGSLATTHDVAHDADAEHEHDDARDHRHDGRLPAG